MTTTRKLIWAFWIFIIITLVWQFYNYNQGMTQLAIEHPNPAHYFYFHTNAVATPNPPANLHRDGAYVTQSAFTFQNNTPSPGSFTCSVTLKNEGAAKATSVEVHVRPYKGITLGDEDNDMNTKKLLDSDPLSQLGQWVTFPDLAPGQSATGTATFLGKPGITPGNNPEPEIIYESDKTAAKPRLPTPPPQF